MQQQQRFTLVLALVFAVVSGGLFWAYLKGLDRPQAQVEQRIVFVAAKDITAKTAMTPALIESLSRPKTSVDPDAITSLAEIEGKVALTAIPTGSTITRSRVGKLPDDAVATTLSRGTRAVTIPIDNIRGVANLIQPGDHVDVMAIQRPFTPGQPAKVQTIMRGAMVLAMGKLTQQAAYANHLGGNSDSTVPDAQTVTLAVNPKDAEEIATADATASSLRLTLRSTKEPVPKVVAAPFVPLTPPPTAAPKAEAAAPAPAAPGQPAPVVKVVTPTPQRGFAITVIDGDHVIGGGQ